MVICMLPVHHVNTIISKNCRFINNSASCASCLILWRDVGYSVVQVRQIAVANVKRFMYYQRASSSHRQSVCVGVKTESTVERVGHPAYEDACVECQEPVRNGGQDSVA